MTLLSINPATGTLLRSYDTLSATALTDKITDAQRGFEQFSETPLEDRIMWMKKLAGILEQEMEELATLIATETGKAIRAAREEVLQCAACCRYFAENASELLEAETVEIDATRCTTVWRPMGVLLAVMSGSSPLWQSFRSAVPALLGGNVVLLKHAANVPQCAVEMELLLRRAGFSRGVFQALLIDSADVEIVLNDVRIAGVALAGLKQAGREVAAHTAWMGKKAVTDQAGSNALIVMPSANLFAAIHGAVAARCMDNGQSNDSTARFIVHESVYDEFALLFATAMEDVKIGNPLKDETELGPLSTEESVIRLKAQIASAVAAGGSVLTGGEAMLGDGNYFEPTVIVEIPVDAPVCLEDIHGPVALLFKVTSAQDAIHLANRASGSGVSVWTQDEVEKQQFGRSLRCGSVFMNSRMVLDARMTSGSLTGVGCGHTMAASSLRDFMSARTVVTAGLIPGSDLSFDLSLAEFEKEVELAETASEPQEATAYPSFEAAEFEDDLFARSPSEEVEPSSPVKKLHPDLEACTVPATIRLLEMPEVEPVNDVLAVASPAIAPKRTAASKKVSARKKVSAGEARRAKQSAVAVKAPAAKPVVVDEPVALAPEVKDVLEMASQSSALSFKEMFERALLVRV